MPVVGRLRFVPVPSGAPTVSETAASPALSQPAAAPLRRHRDRWHLRREMRGVPCRVQHDRCHGPDRDAADTGSSVPVVMTRQGDMPMYRLRQAPVPVLAASLALLLAGPVSAATPSTERVSVSSAGEQGNGDSACYPSISADGRFVAFESAATNLVAGDTNGTGRRLRARPEAGHDETRERVQRRGAGERLAPARPVDLRRRPLRRLRVLGLQPRGGRHERHGRRLRARPRSGHDRARERVQRRGAGERLAPATRRSPPTAASSPSSPTPPTSWRATRTATMTSSCATGSGARRSA